MMVPPCGETGGGNYLATNTGTKLNDSEAHWTRSSPLALTKAL